MIVQAGKTMLMFFVVGILLWQRCKGALNSGFTTCEAKDPNFGKCLDAAIESGIKLLKNGLAEYNLLPLDPYAMATLKAGAGSGAVHLEQYYQDLTITGYTDVQVNNSHVDFDKKTLTFSTMHPLLTQKADYDVNGKIMMLPVHGKGPSTVVLENCFSNHRIEFDEKQNGDDTYYEPNSYSLKMHPGHARYLFENLFDGNKLLGDNINRVINEEWLTIFKDVAEGYESAYGKVFLDYAKAIFGKTPMNEIFVQ